MKILYYGFPIKISSPGGPAMVALNLVPALLKLGVKVKTFPTTGGSFLPNKKYLKEIFKAYINYIKEDFHVIHFNMTPIWLNGSFPILCRLKRIPIVYIIHGILKLESTYENKKNISLLKIAEEMYDIADILVVNSTPMKQLLIKEYPKIPQEKIRIILNGVDTKKFNTNEKLQWNGKPNILFVGRLHPVKGVDILIRAIKLLEYQLPKIFLYIAGTGPLEKELFQLVKELEIEDRVKFLGFIPPEELPIYYNSADICVFPSIYEPFSLVTIEAMASGKPVIASKVGGLAEIIKDGDNGILVEPNNPDTLAYAINKVWEDKNLYSYLSQNALHSSKSYDWENIARQYLELYKELI